MSHVCQAVGVVIDLLLSDGLSCASIFHIGTCLDVGRKPQTGALVVNI